jgi:hypothetical protein
VISKTIFYNFTQNEKNRNSKMNVFIIDIMWKSKTKNLLQSTTCISRHFFLIALMVLVSFSEAGEFSSCDKSRTVLTQVFGEISHTTSPNGSNYTQNSHCEWLIKAENQRQFITLTFKMLHTECSYDYIFVYNGDSFHSPLLGSFSGKTEPQKIVASSGFVSIV